MHQQLINKFFRGNRLEDRQLEALQEEFNKEIKELAGKRGCSRCKKNAIRKKYRNKILKLTRK